MQHATIQSGCAGTVAFKLDTVYSDSPSSIYSFCLYGVLVFFSACSPGLVYILGLCCYILSTDEVPIVDPKL